MRIRIEFTAKNREDAARHLNMINYHVLDAIKNAGDKRKHEEVFPLASGARKITVTQE